MTIEAVQERTSIHPDARVGMLALTVSHLQRSLDFYGDAIGCEVLEQSEGRANLGAGGRPFLLLTEQPGAKPWPRGARSYAGLYHFAILVPTRADLGAWVKHWQGLGYPIGQGDHGVSEALYLEDPDGHGIEMYRDRPRAQWHWENGRVHMTTGPVDIPGMIAEADGAGVEFQGLPHEARLGHIHLQVSDIPEARRFYSDVLGFDVVAAMPTALFVSAGGYHHHIGMNTWHSLGADLPPADTVRLERFTVELPGEQARQAVLDRLERAKVSVEREDDGVTVEDPSGVRLGFRIATGPSS